MKRKDKDIIQMELASIPPFHTGDGHPFEVEDDEDIIQIELENILPFHSGDGQFLEVEDDEDMAELEASIDENGILEPVKLRPDVNLEGKYEIIDGHRRVHIARKKGMFTIPYVIEDCDDNSAIKLMVSSNLVSDGEDTTL